MKAHSSSLTSRKGFTLVELLVVISIIAILATLAIAGAGMALNKAKEAKSRAAIEALSKSIELYFDKENQLPLGGDYATDVEKRTDNELMSVLCGLESAQAENPSRTAYFEFKKAKGKGNNLVDGLYRTQTEAQLFGPWKTKNKDDRYYFVIFDYDYDKEIQEPSSLGNEIQYGRKYLIYCYGKDGKIGNENNLDNIYNWK
ncbi:MAG: type II secretion system protein [Verrucomicrobiaceae bacterium]